MTHNCTEFSLLDNPTITRVTFVDGHYINQNVYTLGWIVNLTEFSYFWMAPTFPKCCYIHELPLHLSELLHI